MVAAHPSDLRAAAACGLRTAFVRARRSTARMPGARPPSIPEPTSSPPTSSSSPSCSTPRAVRSPARGSHRPPRPPGGGPSTAARETRTESYCRVIVIGTLMAVGALAGPISTSP